VTRLINSAGIALIKDYEGLRLEPYQDGAGIWTCGYGHTRGVTEHTHCTPEIAESWLEADLQDAEDAVSRLVKVKLTDNQFAAMVSFAFNEGQGKLAGSTLLKKLNEGGYDLVPACLKSWIFVSGKQSPGLVRRRNAECTLWSKS
jgi:lysozyme